jgi:hypothetical protein
MLSVIDSQYALSAVLSLHIAIFLTALLFGADERVMHCVHESSLRFPTNLSRRSPAAAARGADNNAPPYAGHYSVRESPSVSLARRVRSPAQPSGGTLRR